MEITCSNINTLYSIITSISPLNFTIIENHTNILTILSSIELSKESKDILHNICNKMHIKLTTSLYDNIYYFDDEFGLRYIGFGVFDNNVHKHTIVLGPYLKYNSNNLTEAKELLPNGTAPFHTSLQILNDNEEKIISSISLALSNYKFIENNFIKFECNCINTNIFDDNDTQKDLLDIKQRYEFEKEILQYICNGDEEKSLSLINKLIPRMNNKFPTIPLRSIQNLALSFNTLYRKAVEKNNIDFFSLHVTVKKFEKEIESCKYKKDVRRIFPQMISAYCTLIKDYNNNNHSKIVSNAINYIKLNFKSNISLEVISKDLYVHKTYLAKKFKEETNKTTSQYINEIRIKEAKFLLLSTDYSIEHISNLIGYNDVKYFSKIFKKLSNKSPSEYRNYKIKTC